MPAPRGTEDFVAESLRRLEDSVAAGFRDMRAQLSELPRQYVSQREFDRARDDIVIDLAAERRDREQDIKDLKDTAAEHQHAREAFFRWLVGLTITAGVSVAGVVVAIIALIH